MSRPKPNLPGDGQPQRQVRWTRVIAVLVLFVVFASQSNTALDVVAWFISVMLVVWMFVGLFRVLRWYFVPRR